MRVLFLTTRFPFPPVGGDRVRAYHLLRLLCRNHSVDLATVGEEGLLGAGKDDAFRELNRVTLLVTDRLERFLSGVHGFARGVPTQVGLYWRPAYARSIREAAKEYDLVFAHLVRMAEYVRDLPVPVVMDYTDAISRHYYEAAGHGRGLWRLWYRLERRRLLAFEGEASRHCRAVLVTTNLDRDWLIDRSGVDPARIRVVPNGVEPAALEAHRQDGSKRIAFFGKMSYRPNADAADFLARDVLPELVRAGEDVTLTIVGAEPTRRVRRLGRNGRVSVTGFVDDPYPILLDARVHVAPMRIGAGIQNKVLEGMALGKPVVSTRRGVAGIEGREGTHFMVGETAREIADAVRTLLADRAARCRIGGAARELVREKYRWERVGDQLDEILADVT